ncbi:Unknown protein sequence [Pseudomonas syringae pv. coryli]|uniref:Uncharacterized protein n=1 Tax=Pseudomonas syringae pv. coryli TaxID=317659 RepID=A0A0P9MTP3_9PSED|nr:Unknown protein sequence [Pseudomonas syringae pv. coryli]
MQKGKTISQGPAFLATFAQKCLQMRHQPAQISIDRLRVQCAPALEKTHLTARRAPRLRIERHAGLEGDREEVAAVHGFTRGTERITSILAKRLQRAVNVHGHGLQRRGAQRQVPYGAGQVARRAAKQLHDGFIDRQLAFATAVLDPYITTVFRPCGGYLMVPDLKFVTALAGERRHCRAETGVEPGLAEHSRMAIRCQLEGLDVGLFAGGVATFPIVDRQMVALERIAQRDQQVLRDGRLLDCKRRLYKQRTMHIDAIEQMADVHPVRLQADDRQRDGGTGQVLAAFIAQRAVRILKEHRPVGIPACQYPVAASQVSDGGQLTQQRRVRGNGIQRVVIAAERLLMTDFPATKHNSRLRGRGLRHAHLPGKVNSEPTRLTGKVEFRIEILLKRRVPLRQKVAHHVGYGFKVFLHLAQRVQGPAAAIFDFDLGELRTPVDHAADIEVRPETITGPQRFEIDVDPGAPERLEPKQVRRGHRAGVSFDIGKRHRLIGVEVFAAQFRVLEKPFALDCHQPVGLGNERDVTGFEGVTRHFEDMRFIVVGLKVTVDFQHQVLEGALSECLVHRGGQLPHVRYLKRGEFTFQLHFRTPAHVPAVITQHRLRNGDARSGRSGQTLPGPPDSTFDRFDIHQVQEQGPGFALVNVVINATFIGVMHHRQGGHQGLIGRSTIERRIQHMHARTAVLGTLALPGIEHLKVEVFHGHRHMSVMGIGKPLRMQRTAGDEQAVVRVTGSRSLCVDNGDQRRIEAAVEGVRIEKQQ